MVKIIAYPPYVLPLDLNSNRLGKKRLMRILIFGLADIRFHNKEELSYRARLL